MALKVRTLTAEEAYALRRLAGSRTASHRVAPRADSTGERPRGDSTDYCAPGCTLSVPGRRLDRLLSPAWLRRLSRCSARWTPASTREDGTRQGDRLGAYQVAVRLVC
jgi:hypothetical protein